MSFSVEEQRFVDGLVARIDELEYVTKIKKRPDPSELPPAPPPTAEQRLAELEAKLAALSGPDKASKASKPSDSTTGEANRSSDQAA